jgi:Xaa-Pro dipeptidase
MVSGMRLIKSPDEIAYQCRAAKSAEAGMGAGIEAAREGSSERDVASAISTAMIQSGSDSPGPGVLASGEAAFHLHGSYGNRVLKRGDVVQIETTPNVHNYHARFMRSIKVSEATAEEHRTVEKLIFIQDQALREVGPGISAAVPDSIYRDGVISAGLRKTYTNKTFYSIGLLLPPNFGEALEAVAGSTWQFAPGMVFHTYLLAHGFGISETIAVTETGFERLTNFPRKLFVT